MQLFTWHLVYTPTVPRAIQLFRDELTILLHHKHEDLIITMYTGVWRIFADNCLDHLIRHVAKEEDILSPQCQSRTLSHLQRPVTWVLLYLGVQDLQ